MDRLAPALLAAYCVCHSSSPLVLIFTVNLSPLYYDQIRTMKANYAVEAGDVRVIRPLVYVRESMTRDFSVAAHLPIINENCPACFEQPKVHIPITCLS